MKIGILTFHEIFNPGAFLQALGTCTLLREMGHEPWIIDYTTPSHRFSVARIVKNWRLWRRPLTMAELFGRHRAFQRAQIHLPRTQKFVTRSELLSQRFDAVLIGSDIVWDHQNERLGNDPVYFGKDFHSDNILSFAASCGRTLYTVTPPGYVVQGLKNLSAISVRDENTRQFVKQHGNRDAVVICDPAFHLNDSKWLGSIRSGREHYLLVYALPNCISPRLVDELKMYAHERGLKTLAVCYRHKWADENRICIDPIEWLSFVYGAQCMVTNTFHGSIFAAKAGIPFVTELNDEIRYKVATVLEYLGLENRVLREGVRLDDIMDHAWPVESVHKRIAIWRDEARQFLEASLKGGSDL